MKVKSPAILFLQSACIAALLMMGCSLFLPMRGEEGVHVSQVLEMHYSGSFLTVTEFGRPYQRPPLFNLVIAGIAHCVGPQHTLAAGRASAIFFTLCSALLVFRMAVRLGDNRETAWWSLALFLAGDTLMKRGWVAYADPQFAFFVFSSILCFWMFARGGPTRWLLLCSTAGLLAFFTKALTVLVFLATAGAVLACQARRLPGPRRRILAGLFTTLSTIIAGILLSLYLTPTWRAMAGHDIGSKLAHADFLPYILDTLESLLLWSIKLLPLSAAAVFAARHRTRPKWASTAGAMAAVSITPYLLAPGSHPLRYLLPVYGLLALSAGPALAASSRRVKKLFGLLIVISLLLKIAQLTHPSAFDVIGSRNHETAAEILALVGDSQLYVCAEPGQTLDPSITAEINLQRFPEQPLQWKPEQPSEPWFLLSPAPLEGSIMLDTMPNSLHRIVLQRIP